MAKRKKKRAPLQKITIDQFAEWAYNQITGIPPKLGQLQNVSVRQYLWLEYDELSSNSGIWISAAVQYKKAADCLISQIKVDDDAERKYSEWLNRRMEAGDENKRDVEPVIPLPIVDVYMYLMGVSIENLLKGILIEEQEPLRDVVEGGHNLDQLYIKCNGLVAENDARESELRLLTILKHFIKWAGRYNLHRDPDILADELLKDNLGIRSSRCGPDLIYGPFMSIMLKKSDRDRTVVLYERFLKYWQKLAKTKPNRSESMNIE